jgi:hypothetical protein
MRRSILWPSWAAQKNINGSTFWLSLVVWKSVMGSAVWPSRVVRKSVMVFPAELWGLRRSILWPTCVVRKDVNGSTLWPSCVVQKSVMRNIRPSCVVRKNVKESILWLSHGMDKCYGDCCPAKPCGTKKMLMGVSFGHGMEMCYEYFLAELCGMRRSILWPTRVAQECYTLDRSM